MSTNPRTAKDIFVELVGNVPPDQWADRLEVVYHGDIDLRDRVRALLRAHAEPGSFLEQPAMAGEATWNHDQLVAEGPGTVIGPYKLLEQIGEGGFGVVFLAEQERVDLHLGPSSDLMRRFRLALRSTASQVLDQTIPIRVAPWLCASARGRSGAGSFRSPRPAAAR